MIKYGLILLGIIIFIIVGSMPTNANEILSYLFLGITTVITIILIIKLIIYIKSKKRENKSNITKHKPIYSKEYYDKYVKYREPVITKEDELYSEYLKEKQLDEEQEFYEKQIKKLSKCEKLYYDVLYNHYKDNYIIEAQVYLRSMFPKMGAENHRIDIIFKDKQWEKPILLIEINDETHSRNTVTRMRDKDLKEFCKKHNIKLQALWTKFGINKYSIIKLIDKKLKE